MLTSFVGIAFLPGRVQAVDPLLLKFNQLVLTGGPGRIIQHLLHKHKIIHKFETEGPRLPSAVTMTFHSSILTLKWICLFFLSQKAVTQHACSSFLGVHGPVSR